MVYWNSNEIGAAVIGGALIALATSLNLYFYGRITGLSGVFNSVIKHDTESGFIWKFSFLVGLITIPFLTFIFASTDIKMFGSTFYVFDSVAIGNVRLSILGYILGGFLVGVGTRMGNGCTSGHGVCGIPRLSKRSIVATLTFMAAGMFLATIRYNFPFLVGAYNQTSKFEETVSWITFVAFFLLVAGFVFILIKNFNRIFALEYFISFVVGLIFGTGLMISGMCRVTKIAGFLTLTSNWDPTLAFVMLSAVGINFVSFHFIMKGHPKFALMFKVPVNNQIDTQLVGGAAIFGLGWGLSCLCPGPGMINFFVFSDAVFWILALALGQLGYDYYVSRFRKTECAMAEPLIQ